MLGEKGTILVEAKSAAAARAGTSLVTFKASPVLMKAVGMAITGTTSAKEFDVVNTLNVEVSVGDILSITKSIQGFFIVCGSSVASSVKIFRSPSAGIAAATWDEMADELTAPNEDCQEYAWNTAGTKLIGVTTIEIIEEVPTEVPVKYSVANHAFGRIPGAICIPVGFTEDAEVCEEDPLPAVPELDPPCEYDTRSLQPYFFLGVRHGLHYIHTEPLMPTKRVHVLQRPQLQEDIYGVRTLVFPMYDVRLPLPVHDGCEPLPFAVCGPAGAAVPCE